MRKQTKQRALLLLAGILCLGLFGLFSKTAQAANPTTINFQGKVVNADGTNVANGSYTFIFRLYDNSAPTIGVNCNTNSQCWWEETDTLTVTNGVFQVDLGSGSGCAFTSACNSTHSGIDWNTNNSLYLTMNFNGDSSGTHNGYMYPVIHLNTVPYAFNADKLAGLASSAFAQLAQAAAFTSSVSVQPATNIAALTVKQNSNGSPTADILDIQTQNATGVITVTGPALNEAAVTITSVGATRDLTLGSASGIIKFSAATTSLQKAASAFTLDLTNAGASTLTISNSNGANIANLSVTGDIAAGSGHVFKVGATSGSTVAACSAGQFVQAQATTGGIVTTSGSCVNVNSQTTLQNAYDNSGTPATITTSGSTKGVLIKAGASADSTTLFQVQNSGGAQLLNIDSSTTQNLLAANPSFEVDASSWAALNGSGTSTLTQVTASTTTPYSGNGSLQIATTGTSTNAGAKYNVTLNGTTTYTLSMYVKASGNTNLSTLQIGRSEDGTAGSETSCATAQSAVVSTWTRLTCTFTTGDAPSGTTYIYIKQTDSTNHTYYVDAVQLETKTNLLTNPGAESALGAEWAALANTNAPVRSVTAGHFNSGVAGIDVTPTTTGTNRGVKNVVSLGSYTTYTLSIWAKDPNASASGMEVGRSEDGSTFSACATALTINTSFRQLNCTFTTGSTSGATFIYLRDGNSRTSAAPFYVDSAQLYTGTSTSATAFQLGQISLNGVINSPVGLRNQADSTNSFQIQNAAGFSLFNVDSANSLISVSNGTSVLQTTTAAFYMGGADVTGATNTGAGNVLVNDVVVSGKYEYVVTAGSATACNAGVGNAVGCELQIYDVSNPASPAFIGGADVNGTSSATGGGTGNLAMNWINVVGKYAYIVTQGSATACASGAGNAIGCEFQIYDISNPTNPVYMGGADGSGSTNAGTASDFYRGIFVSGRYAYLGKTANGTACSQVAGSAIGCELQIYDITNPSLPTYLSGMDATGLNNGTGAGPNINTIYVSGRYAYTGGSGDPGACSSTAGSAIGCELKVWDISNPAAPTYVGGGDNTGTTNGGSGSVNNFRSVYVSGRYAYTANTGDSGTCSATAGSAIGCELKVWDISNPAAPTYVGGGDDSGTTNGGTSSNSGTTSTATVSGRYAYMSVGSGLSQSGCTATAGYADGCGLKIWDISNPATPTYIGGTNNTGSTNSGISGTNGGFDAVYLSGRYVYTAGSGSAGTCSGTAGSADGCEIKVWDATGIEATSVTAGSLFAGSVQVQNAAQFNDQVSITGGLTVGSGIQATGDVGINGRVNVMTTNNSTTAFLVQNSGAQTLLNIDTTGSTSLSANNLVTCSDFESCTTNWTGRNTSTAAQDSGQSWLHSNSLLVTPNTTATSDGAKYTFGSSLGVGNTYTYAVYVRAKNTNISTFEIGYTNTGGDNSCSTAQYVDVYGWTRISCNFTVATTAATSVYVRQTDNTTNAQPFYIDAVQVETDVNTTTNYKTGQITVPATFTNPITIQTSDNTNGALQIQNAAGSQIFSIDTNDTNLISNPGFEVTTTGWTAKSGTPAITRDGTASPYLGLASLKVVTAANTTDGVKFTFSPTTLIRASTVYEFSFYAKLSAGSIATLTFGRDDVSGTDVNCSTTSTINTTWQRYSCNYTTGVTITNPFVYVVAGTASQTFYVDAVQIEQGSTLNAYGSGALYLNGVIQSPIQIQNKVDSTTAFLLQGSTGISLLTGDTANLKIQIGSSTTDANAVVLVLDSYNNATDPAGGAINGAMYYNTSTVTFRCYQGGAWRNCLGGGPSNQSTATQAPAAGTDTYLTNSSIPLPAGGFRGPTGSGQDGSKVTWRVVMSKTAAGLTASTFNIRVGTNGTTGDTLRCSAFSTGVATAAIDWAVVTITVFATAGGSGTTFNCSATLNHWDNTGGFTPSGTAGVQAYSTQASFDSTPAGTKIGLSFNGSSTSTITIQSVDVTSSNL